MYYNLKSGGIENLVTDMLESNAQDFLIDCTRGIQVISNNFAGRNVSRSSLHINKIDD